MVRLQDLLEKVKTTCAAFNALRVVDEEDPLPSEDEDEDDLAAQTELRRAYDAHLSALNAYSCAFCKEFSDFRDSHSYSENKHKHKEMRNIALASVKAIEDFADWF